MTTEAIAQPQSGASTCHMNRYIRVDTSRVDAPNMKDVRRPLVSATMPVGTSNSTSRR